VIDGIQDSNRHEKANDQRGDALKTVAGLVPEVNVGDSLRTLREERGLSIRSLAERSGLAVNTLSLIENRKTSPSVSTLQRLAVALDVPITAFFEHDAPEQDVVYFKAEERLRASFEYGTFEDLGSSLAGCLMEPLIISLEADTDSGPYPIVHTGHELVYCLRGQITYTIEEERFALYPGDSLFFAAHLPHRWRCTNDVSSQALLILCPSDKLDRPTERHFEVPESYSPQ
jgi:transcriptional regulator with XRE-family HTH domain